MSQLLSNTTGLQEILDALANKTAGSGGVELPELSNPATASQILIDTQVINQNGNIVIGTMPNNGTILESFDGIITKEYDIPLGYTDGGTIRLDGTIDTEVYKQSELIDQIVNALEKKASIKEPIEWSEAEDAMLTNTLTEYTNDRVTSVGCRAFACAFNLIAVSFPRCITIEGYPGVGNFRGGAFYYCTSLTNVSFPACTSIGSSAFYGCTSLTNVNFPVCTSIDRNAFCDCSSLTNVSFPVCTNIHYGAFVNCRSLKNVSFPVCTNIGSSAFRNCPSLTSVSFPACTNIGSSAFAHCSSLTNVSFPACTSIGSNAFNGCYSLTSVNFPVCTSIGSYAFSGCSSLTSVNFPVCTNIGGSAFRGCFSLTTANFPVCTNINGYAFQKCYRLSSLTLGASTICTLLNSNAFNETPYVGYSSYFSGTPHIYVPSSLVASYQAATNWTYFSSYITAIE